MGFLREKLQMYQKTVTTDGTVLTATGYTGRKIRHLRPPFVLSLDTSNAGATAPTGTISIKVQIQDSDDGSTWNTITAWTIAAVSAAGTKNRQKAYANQIREWVRVTSKTLAAGTWAAGTLVKVFLTGDAGLS
jgi:hypothetical protein